MFNFFSTQLILILISSKDVWTIGEINIRVLYEYKVVFYMEKQPDKTSFIALDDLSLLSHRCQTPVSAKKGFFIRSFHFLTSNLL